MISSKATEEAFQKIFEEPRNRTCFECDSPANQWASVNNGIILCLNCSGLHRGFGVNVSFVRSITMDTWNEKQLLMILNGGNAKLKEFFQSYNIPENAPIAHKYKTKAGLFYRERLKAIVEGRPEPAAPDPHEALELVENPKPSFGAQPQAFGSAPPEEEKNEIKESLSKGLTTFVGFMGKAWNKTVDVTKETSKKVNDKWNDPQFQQNLKEFGNKVTTTAGTVATKVVETSQKIGKESVVMVSKGYDEVKKLVNQQPNQRQPEAYEEYFQANQGGQVNYGVPGAPVGQPGAGVPPQNAPGPAQ